MNKQYVPQGDPVIVKKYANRRLYNTDTSSYVTLDDLAHMVQGERDFVVYDAKSGEDLTHAVLTQIIVEQESKGENLLPIPFLRQLIRFYGHSIQQLVPRYLEFSLHRLTEEQERYRKQFADAFGPAKAFEAINEQARKNFAIFESALGIFSPFPTGDNSAGQSSGEDADASATSGKTCARMQPEPATDAAGKTSKNGDEIGKLKAELSAMQRKLDDLSRR